MKHLEDIHEPLTNEEQEHLRQMACLGGAYDAWVLRALASISAERVAREQVEAGAAVLREALVRAREHLSTTMIPCSVSEVNTALDSITAGVDLLDRVAALETERDQLRQRHTDLHRRAQSAESEAKQKVEVPEGIEDRWSIRDYWRAARVLRNFCGWPDYDASEGFLNALAEKAVGRAEGSEAGAAALRVAMDGLLEEADLLRGFNQSTYPRTAGGALLGLPNTGYGASNRARAVLDSTTAGANLIAKVRGLEDKARKYDDLMSLANDALGAIDENDLRRAAMTEEERVADDEAWVRGATEWVCSGPSDTEIRGAPEPNPSVEAFESIIQAARDHITAHPDDTPDELRSILFELPKDTTNES